MKKIRVIHFVDRIHRGGTQAVLFEWVKHVDRSRFQFDFLTFLDGREEYIEEFKKYGCNIYQISKLSIGNFPSFMSDLDDFFATHKYDIAHGHSKSKNVLFLWKAKKYGINVRIAHSHNTKFHRMALIGNLLKPLLNAVSTDFFACSEPAGEWLFGKRKVIEGKVKIIKNGVDTTQFTYNEGNRIKYRKQFEISNKLVIGHVGRYMHQKNHKFLIEIFRCIHEINDQSVLLLVGAGDDDIQNYVDKKIEEYNLKNCVIQTGLRQDVANLMQAMDIFILPSLHEGLPVVGVEAQAAGLPCVFSDTITREVALLDTTKFVQLDKSAEFWASETVSLVNCHDRKQASQSVYDQGYDSQTVTDYLMNIYKERLAIE